MANLKIDLIVDDKGSVTVNKVVDSFGKLDKAARAADSTVTGIHSALGKIAGLVGGAFAVSSLVGFGKQALEAMDNLDEMSEKVGVSTTTLQVFGHMAKLSGADIDAVSKSLSIMSKNIVSEVEDANKAFTSLGISVRDQNGALKSSDSLLAEVANKFSKMEDGTTKTALAMMLFGKSGKDMIPMLNQGGEGIQEMHDRLKRLGILIDEETVSAAGRFNDNLDELGMMTKGLAMNVMGQLTPALDNLVTAFLESDATGEQLKNTAEVIGTVFKGIASVVIGGVAAFDIAGTTIGEFFARFAEKSAGGVVVVDEFGNAMVELGKTALKADAAMGGDPSALEKKLQHYGSLMDAFWNKNESSTKKAKKTTDPYTPTFNKDNEKEIKRIEEQIEKELNKMTLTVEEQARKQADEWNTLGVDRVKTADWLTAKISEIEQKRSLDSLKLTAQTEERRLKEWETAASEYSKILSEEADFATTTNQREINKITSQENTKLGKLYELYAADKINFEQLEEAKTQVEKNAGAARLNSATETARLQLEAQKTLYDGIAGMESLSADASILLLDNKLTRILTEIGSALSEEEKAELKKRALAQGTTEILTAVNIARLADMKTYYDSVDALGAAGGLVDDHLLTLRSEKLKNTLIAMMGEEAGYAAYLVYLDIEKEKNWLAKNIKRESDIVSTLGNIKGYEKEAHDARIALIDLEAAKRVLEGQNAVNVAIWVKDQQALAYIQMGKDSDSWVEGAEAKLLELSRAHTTWGKTAGDAMGAFATDATKQLTDNFFNVLSGDFKNIGLDWDSLLDSMKKSLASSLANMIMEAAAHDILLLFKSDWVEGGSNVLGIINKVIGIGADIIDWFSPGGGKAYGGLIPGAASGIDSLMNDTVPTMLSPGEYVLPASLVNAVMGKGRQGDTMLAHINPAEAAVLKMLGGSGTINPRTGLPEFFSVREGANAVDISGAYPFGAPMAGGIGPASILDTTAGTRYYVPLDLILGGAQSIQNTGYIDPRTGKSYGEGRWYYPAVPTDVSGLIQTLPLISAPQDWINASVSGKWGGIDNPTRGFYLNADQYQALYGGMYQSPVPTYDPVNAVPIDWSNMHLKGGIYAGGGVDTWWELDPRTGTSTVYSQEGRNQSAASGMWAALSQLLFTIGGTMLGAPYLGAYLGTAGGMAAGAGMGAAAGAQATGQNLEDTLKSAAMAAAMAYIAGIITSPTAPSTSAAEIADISAGESAAWGYAPTSSMEEIAAAMQEAGTLPSTFDKMLAKAEEYIARKAIKTGISAIMPGVDTGDLNTGQMKISYMGAQDGGLLSELSKIMEDMRGQEQFSFHAQNGLDYVPYDNFPIRAHRGEAVLDRQEAGDWRQSGGTETLQPIRIVIELDGAVIAEKLFNLSKRGVAVVHERGVGK